jgi:hypothetical protein
LRHAAPLAFRRQRLQPTFLHQPSAHRPHEGFEAGTGQAIVEGFVGDPHALLMTEGPEQVI